MEQKEKETDNIELRSEKVRNVIGKVPPRLVSLGTVVITIIVLALAVAFYKIPYPISIEANGEVINQASLHTCSVFMCKCLCHTSICIFSMSQGRLMYLSRATIMHLITATSQAIKPGSYIGKMVTILWL